MAADPARGEDGFAAVDATVALLILASTLILSLSGLQTAAHLSNAAADAASAEALARQVLTQGGDGVSQEAGRAGRLRWSLRTERLSTEDAGGVCSQVLWVRSLITRKAYRFASAVAC